MKLLLCTACQRHVDFFTLQREYRECLNSVL